MEQVNKIAYSNMMRRTHRHRYKPNEHSTVTIIPNHYNEFEFLMTNKHKTINIWWPIWNWCIHHKMKSTECLYLKICKLRKLCLCLFVCLWREKETIELISPICHFFSTRSIRSERKQSASILFQTLSAPSPRSLFFHTHPYTYSTLL